MITALLLIDFQEDFYARGRMALEDSLAATQQAEKVLALFRSKKQLVVHTQHTFTHPGAKYLLPCTRGTSFYKTMRPIKGETVIKKHYPNAFRDTLLLKFLQKENVTHLVIGGMMTHLSVAATIRAAYDFGFSCTLLRDACAAKSLESGGAIISAQQIQQTFMAALQQMYAKVLTTDKLLSTAI